MAALEGGGVLVNVQEGGGCLSISWGANDVTRAMSKGGVLSSPPPPLSGNPVSKPGFLNCCFLGQHEKHSFSRKRFHDFSCNLTLFPGLSQEPMMRFGTCDSSYDLVMKGCKHESQMGPAIPCDFQSQDLDLVTT